MDNSKLSLLASWMKESKYTVVLTGAGMSTESGIPDFRSAGGWWRNIDPATVASTQALSNQYELFREFYTMRINTLEGCKPHEGHKILAELEKRGLIHCIATQNVDRFHQEAGSGNVYELHGNIRTVRCEDCTTEAALKDFTDGKPCFRCGGKLRPNVVLFGESLPCDALDNTVHAISKADLVIVIGTSLQVYPVNQLPNLCKGRKAYINLDTGGNCSQFDLVIEGSAGNVLFELKLLLDKQ
jgi:NAD-dependent deacetylase